MALAKDEGKYSIMTTTVEDITYETKPLPYYLTDKARLILIRIRLDEIEQLLDEMGR
jgi:hypothetical protein